MNDSNKKKTILYKKFFSPLRKDIPIYLLRQFLFMLIIYSR